MIPLYNNLNCILIIIHRYCCFKMELMDGSHTSLANCQLKSLSIFVLMITGMANTQGCLFAVHKHV